MADTGTIETNSAKAWILASRPKTLAGAATPVIMGSGYAWMHMSGTSAPFDWPVFLLCMLFAWIMQIDANFINDYFDYRKGGDTENRLGPQRACAQGWISQKAMRTGIILTTVLACIAGAPLILTGGWWMLAVGAACVLFCFLYTTVFSRLGLGDILVLIFFGIIPVGFTFFLLTGEWTSGATLTGLSCGFAVDCLLTVNNYRDRKEDAENGKNTLAVRFGGKTSVILYYVLGTAAAILASYVILTSGREWKALLILPYLMLHLMTAYRISRTDGKALNSFLGRTSGNFFLLALLFTAASIL